MSGMPPVNRCGNRRRKVRIWSLREWNGQHGEMAPVLQEERLLQVAHHYEQAADVMATRPQASLVA